MATCLHAAYMPKLQKIQQTLFDAPYMGGGSGGCLGAPLDTNEQVWNFPFLQAKIGIKEGLPVGAPGELVRVPENPGGCPKEEKKPKSVKSLTIKAVRKIAQRAFASRMIDYARAHNSPNLAEYWAVFRCENTYSQVGNSLIGKGRCGSRLCQNCSRIRTAKAMDLVLPEVLNALNKSWGTLVLTRSNAGLMGCNHADLREDIKDMTKVLNRIVDRYRKAYGKSVNSIISVEVTPEGYKRKKEDGSMYYAPAHPHLHLFGEYEQLEYIREAWLNYHRKIGWECYPINNVIKSIDAKDDRQLKKALQETLKYSIKPMVAVSKKSDGNDKYACMDGIDTLVSALKGTRRLRMTGMFKGVSSRVADIELKEVDELDLVKQEYFDIPIKDSGEVVSCVDIRGNIIKNIPEYVEAIDWIWSDEHRTHIYTDRDDKLWYLYPPPRPPKPENRYRVVFTIEKKIVDIWSNE